MNNYTKSAGGVVVRKKGNIVEIILLRDLKFDDRTLPKGHVENGESLEQTCKREVYEEAGLTGVVVHSLLGEFKRKVRDTNEIKTIHYFLMTLENPDVPLIETADNKGFEVKWHNIDTLPSLYLEEQEKIINENIELIKKVCL